MSNELKKIVKKIQFRTDKTIEEIAKDIGYARSYFTNQVNIGTNKTLKSLLEKYLLDNEQNVTSDAKSDTTYVVPQIANELAKLHTLLPLGDLTVTLKDYVTLLIETKNKAEEREKRLLALLEKDMTVLKSNSETIQADLEQVARMVRADDMEMMEGTDKTLGRESGTTALRAGIVERAFSEADKETHTSDSKGKKGNSGRAKQQGKA